MGLRESLLARTIPLCYEDPVDAFREFCLSQWTLLESQPGSLQYDEVLSLLANIFDYVDPMLRRVR